MYTITCDLVGTTKLSFSKPVVEPKKKAEKHDAYEERTWQERAHVDKKGKLYIPAIALKKALECTAAYLGEKIKGKGNATYTKHFKAGIIIRDDLMLGAELGDCIKEPVFGSSDGKPGGGKRVLKFFPTLDKGWKARAVIEVFDDIIEPDIVEDYLGRAGQFIGLLRWRPANGGLYGRYKIENFKVISGKK